MNRGPCTCTDPMRVAHDCPWRDHEGHRASGDTPAPTRGAVDLEALAAMREQAEAALERERALEQIVPVSLRPATLLALCAELSALRTENKALRERVAELERQCARWDANAVKP